MPSRLATRKTWVSTARVDSPKAVLRTTLAVLRPTPGSASSASRSGGTSPSVPLDQRLRQRDDVPRLRPIEADRLDLLGEPVLAERRHLLPACRRRRTAPWSPCSPHASVACAESTTATSRVNGLTDSSSPIGSGLAASSRSNTASASAARFFRDVFAVIAPCLVLSFSRAVEPRLPCVDAGNMQLPGAARQAVRRFNVRMWEEK